MSLWSEILQVEDTRGRADDRVRETNAEECQLPEPASAAAISALRSDEDHQSTPDNHRRFGDAGPRRVLSVFVGTPPNADDSHNDVGKRKEVETDGDSVGQAGEDRSDGSRRRQNVGDGAIGDGVVPKGLAERKIATPKRFQRVSHDSSPNTEDSAAGASVRSCKLSPMMRLQADARD